MTTEHYPTPEEDSSLAEVQLRALLDAHLIPHHTWTDRKTITDLLGEIRAGESALRVGEHGLRRHTSVVWVDVYARDGQGMRRHLREARQVFEDGRPPRERTLPASLGEKLLLGNEPEDPEKGVRRALAEELGIQPKALTFRDSNQREAKADSYPGLSTVYTDHFFDAEVDFNPDGYQEVQPGKKTTYFEWEPPFAG